MKNLDSLAAPAAVPQAFRLLRKVNGETVTTVGPTSDMKAAFEALGYEYVGSLKEAQRPLRGAPRFAGLVGPSLEGEALLYIEAP